MFNKTKETVSEKPSEVHVEDTITENHKLEDGGDYSGAVAKTDPKEIALVKKLDIRIMGILWAMYFLNYLDRNAIAQARLNNLEDDLGLVGTQYNTCISILFVGYLLMQIPSNMLMSTQKVRPSIYMCICMMAWAVVSACTALTHNYTGLVVVRFFLGIAEAPYYPGALYLLSLFYTRKEIATRISILYSGNIFATAFSGLIAEATFATLDKKHGLQGWKWLFIIEGAVTFGVAIIGLFLLPDYPLTTRWLTPDERQLAHDRIVRDTVVGSLGFSRTITLVLTCPPYLVSGAFGILIGWTSGRINERTWHITVCMGAALVGFIISCATMNVAARYVACFLFASGAYAVNSVIIGWVSATLGQTAEKKAVSLSIVNVVANASYIYTAYLYPKSDGPKYLTAMASNAAFAFMTIACAWALRFWLQTTNRRLRRDKPEENIYYAY
ncbi:vitamin H transporter [Stagonosporopsis vannaccii]|nr:vitamin H transporter [Stagonosporopsis vannaccii]